MGTTATTIAAHSLPKAEFQANQVRNKSPTTGQIEIEATVFDFPISNDDIADLYDKPSIYLEKGDSLTFVVEIENPGDYTISFDIAAPESFINVPEGQLMVDGKFLLPDMRRIVFPLFYQNTANVFPKDRYGNDALIHQERLIRWSNMVLRDLNHSQKYPLQLELNQGEHEFTFKLNKKTLYLGSIYLSEFSETPNYTRYLEINPADDPSGVFIEMEAEFPTYKNDTSIRPINDRSLGVTPYDTYTLLLNTIGGESWQTSGSTLYYEFSVPEDGYYLITLRELQNMKNNFTVFRRILINDQVLFDEFHEVPFGYSTDWENKTLGQQEPYKIYLKKGKNTLGLQANNSPYHSAIEKIKKVLIDINTLSLEIKKLTGNQVDIYKEWEITEYIPDIKEQLIAIADDLRVDMDILMEINQSGGSEEILTYQLAIDNIRKLAQDPDEIPSQINLFSEGSGSAAQLLGNILPSLQNQPLALDKIYIHSPDQMPEEIEIPFTESFREGLKRFIDSFRPNKYQTIGADEDEIEVWVNRPRQYVDLIQSLVDENFTKKTGIQVKLSIMPDESKLVLANAADIAPDVALGVSTNVPYELAIRNTLYDLRSFHDFDSFISIYSPGAFLHYIINDSVYAIPETQDFWVTYYREDILNSLEIPVPHTWSEVIEILPELQRYGLNFNSPLSSGSGTKGYLVTAPYLFNHGAELYSNDGFSTGLDSEEAIAAIKFMAESFTIYGMPLTTSSFYDSFRYGSLPIGVSNFETYIKLLTAAPEINGLWAIDLYPATVLEDGRELRYATGSAQACIMFSGTDQPDEAWEFMKWWMSTETQVDFQQQLIMNYGITYLWNSANVEAFQYLPISEEHKAVILEQWEWLQEPVKLPGSYMQERELSNVWNKIVFDGVNTRVAIDNSIVIINREITRKMEEFGFMQDGKKVMEFKIPTIESVKRWMENGN
ncbi:MAG TPA: ABC transporter substrate-binding protein [Anaerolineaceae bacterium]|nr:ABC transporter substrate-binding protein [Anaerolineaceae bacterium]